MQHEIHQRQPVRVLNVLHSVEGAPVEALLFGFSQGINVLVINDPAACGNIKTTGASSGILDHISQFGLHHRHHRIDQWPWGEVLPCPRLLLFCIFLQLPFLEVAQSLLFGAVPIKLVDFLHQLVQRDGLFTNELALA